MFYAYVKFYEASTEYLRKLFFFFSESLKNYEKESSITSNQTDVRIAIDLNHLME